MKSRAAIVNITVNIKHIWTERKIYVTSYVTLTPVDAGWRNVTEETTPLPDNMHSALGLCCANDNSLATISCKERDKSLRKEKRVLS